MPPEIARELLGAHGTLVFGAGVNALAGARIVHVGDGYLTARTFERAPSPSGERIEYEHVIPLTALVYFRRVVSDDPADSATPPGLEFSSEEAGR